MNGKIIDQAIDETSVGSPTHPPVYKTLAAAADQGVLPRGMLYALDATGKLIPHALVAPAAMTGDIDGTNKTYTFALGHPVLPGSIAIANNNAAPQSVTDDGQGNLIGDGAGTVNYKTGEGSVTFTTAPAVGKTVTISHKTRLAGVLSKSVDTASDDAAVGIIHGTVNKETLRLGLAGADVTAADLAALEAITIYPQ